MAVGLNSDAYTAELYGYKESELAEMRKHPYFKRELAAMKSELDSNGVTLKIKNVARAEVLQQLYYDDLVANGTLAQRREGAQFFTKMADLEPKPTLNINSTSSVIYRLYRDDDSGTAAEVYESTAVRVEDEVKELPPLPNFLESKRVTANSDLSESV